MTAPVSVLDRQLLRRLPVDDARHGLSLSPGVVLRGTDIGIASEPSLSIRGSARSQIGIYVDGAPARFEALNGPGIALGTDALSELSVFAGVPSVVLADTRGAAISYVTRSGGSRLEGRFSAMSENPFGSGTGVGYNRFEGSLGGPAPGVPGLTWFVSAAVHGQPSEYWGAGARNTPTYTLAGVDTVVEYTDWEGQSASFALPKYAQVSGRCGQTGNPNTAVGTAIQSNYGYECQGLRRPMDWATSSRGLVKLDYSFGHGASLSLTALASDIQRRFFPGSDIGAPGLQEGFRTRSRLAVLNWTQPLGAVLGGAVSLHVNAAYGTDEDLSGPLEVESGAATANPALGIEFRTLRFAGQETVGARVTDEMIRGLRTFSSPPVPYRERHDLDAFQPFRANPYGVSQGWPTQGLDGQLTMVSERRMSGRWLADWEAAPGVTLTAGSDLSRIDVSYYSSDLNSAFGLDADRAKPQRLGLFASGLLEMGHLAVEAGLRADRFTPGAKFPVSPGRIFTNPNWGADPSSDSSYAAAVARVFVEGRAQTVLSPRIRADFRVADRTTARLSYGRQAEPPPLGALYQRINSDLAYTLSSAGFGRDVDVVSTSTVELGFRHEFARGVALDVSGFNKTGLTPYVFRVGQFIDPYDSTMSLASVLTPYDSTSGTGADARLDWRASGAVSGSVAYSLLSVKYPIAVVDVLPDGHGTISSRWDSYLTHSVSGTVSLRAPRSGRAGSVMAAALSGGEADVLFRFTSGLPYTRAANVGDGTITPELASYAAEQLNRSRLPWTGTVDLRLAKSVPWGGASLSAFVEVHNLLGMSNLRSVFAETGTDVNDAFRANFLGPEQAALQNEASDAGAWDNGTVDLTRSCSAWMRPVNCVALRRVENRFGNGDGLYTADERERAFGAFYDAFYGTWSFRGPGRTARAGLEVRF